MSARLLDGNAVARAIRDEVAPGVAVPVHEKVLANPAMVYGLIERMGPAATRWVNLDDGQPQDL